MSLYSTTARQRLPPEVTDQIIDHLHGDTNALKKCNFVCRDWRPAARYHLFHEVKLSGKRSNSLAVLLHGQLSPLSTSICILNVSEIASNIYTSSSALDKAFPTLASSLPAVHTLRLSNVNVSYLSPASVYSLIHGFQSVKTLHMTSVIFHRFEDFTQLIRGHELQELKLRNVWWESEESESDAFRHSPSQNSISRKSTPCRVILHDVSHRISSWLASGTCPLNIVDLDYCTTLDYNLTSLETLLSGIGANLRNLTLNLHPMTHPLLVTEGVQCPQLLSLSPNLKSLAFAGIVLIPPLSKGYEWIVKFLEQVSTDQVEVVSFYILCNQLPALDHFPWKNIAPILSSPIYKRLRKVVFHHKGDAGHRVKSMIEQHLSLLLSGSVGLDFISTY
ncbi:hypothetical protein M422DRAFT_782986 [Sphaerobolus stellatus SS14]|uniref:F-box domain-containing protein n=1 Tax=Sphaerobolus stellatus (strain SS14) TaxID=990650 RepID=A0A0C9TUZ0_SPHS4|nr:hypothetical protein M422DRAFT_782986 [Sphaerobolus stellatus SS14]